MSVSISLRRATVEMLEDTTPDDESFSSWVDVLVVEAIEERARRGVEMPPKPAPQPRPAISEDPLNLEAE